MLSGGRLRRVGFWPIVSARLLPTPLCTCQHSRNVGFGGSGGLMHAQTGLAIQGKALGLLSAAPVEPVQSSRKRFKTADGTQASGQGPEVTDQRPEPSAGQHASGQRPARDAEQTVKLGPASTPYLLCAENSEGSDRSLRVANHIWKEAEKVRVAWPTRGQAIPFASKILQFARAARAYNEDGQPVGFCGGRDPAHGYTVKSFTRGMLIVAETMDPTLFDDVQLEEIQAFAPDENKHTSCLKSWTGLEIRHRFALSPLMLSCYCCIAGWMDIAHMQQMMKFDDAKLMSVLYQWLREKQDLSTRADDYPFPPGPKVLGQMLCE